MTLMPVVEAQARLFTLAPALPVESVPLGDAAGRWLAQDVAALRNQPWADLSAMDGYAIRAGEWPGPWRVTATSAAGGMLPPPLGAGEACRIFTGAPMPTGADAVMLQEDSERTADVVRGMQVGPTAGRHVRGAGSDFAINAPLIAKGAELGAAQIALAAVAGPGALPVRREVSVALLSSGSELVPPGAPVPAGRLPSSNAPMLAAVLKGLPCRIEDKGIARDDLDATTALFGACAGADIIVSTGGASVGDHDLVRAAFERAGGTLDFWKIAMRPGKPLMAGRLGEALFLGLPGNPVSAFVTAQLFLLPLLRHMAGARAPLPPLRSAPLAVALPEAGGREEYLRASRNADGVTAIRSQDSAGLYALSQADCLIRRAAGARAAQAGEMVEILEIRGVI
ncbi:MAG: molybdopterin molybdotransferase MoeA [Sphingobium sp.]